MDFHVYAVIAIVFLVSFFTLLFISKLPRGKTFDEVLAEKRQLAEKLYGPNYGHKNKANKKVNNKKASKKSKVSKEVKESTEELESDANSDGNVSENNSPSHHKGAHVEFVEAEIIPPDGHKKPFTQSANKANIPSKRKNSKLPGHGILINKSETTPVNSEQAVFEQLNHFEETVPKDVVEQKFQKDDVSLPIKDINEGNKHKNATRESKKGKNKKDSHDLEPKENEVPSQNGTDIVTEKIATVTVSKSHDHQPPKSKKKKQEIDAVQKLIDDGEGISVNFLIPLLSKAELTRNEIQILIDFLLNKQQDTIIDHAEWSEGRSDVVQRLKKQLSEKEKALQDEQEATAAIQAKLKELRGEINSERAQFNAQIKAQVDEIHGKKLEIQNLTSEIQYINDKFNVEKQTITVQMQQLQSKLLQEKKTNSQEIIQIEQLNNEVMAKNTVIRELNDKYQHLKLVNEETLKKIAEYENKYSEYELLLHQKDEQKNYFEQEIDNQRKHIQDFQYREQEYSRINVENERLRSDLRRKDEFQNMQQCEYEKLKQQIVDLSKVQHMDDNNKVEIRNLQNALDSSLKEANKLRIEAADSKKIMEDLNNQIRELSTTLKDVIVKSSEQDKQISELGQVDSRLKETLAEKEAKLAQYELQLKSTVDKEDELFKQVQEFKDKNNDLRTKNWKLNEALQKAESNAVKYLNSSNNQSTKSKVNDTPPVDIKKIVENEQDRIKQQIEKILPELNLRNDEKWLENLGTYISNKLSENEKLNSNSNRINNSTNNNKYINNTTNDNEEDENDIDNDSIRNGQMNVILSENKTLKDKLDSYKKLLTETDSLLKNIQKMSEEKEIYYQGVVENKNLEINQLKSQTT